MPRFSESFKRERGGGNVDVGNLEDEREGARAWTGTWGGGVGRTALVSPPVCSIASATELICSYASAKDLTKLALCPAMLPGTVELSAVRTEVLSRNSSCACASPSPAASDTMATDEAATTTWRARNLSAGSRSGFQYRASGRRPSAVQERAVGNREGESPFHQHQFKGMGLGSCAVSVNPDSPRIIPACEGTSRASLSSCIIRPSCFVTRTSTGSLCIQCACSLEPRHRSTSVEYLARTWSASTRRGDLSVADRGAHRHSATATGERRRTPPRRLRLDGEKVRRIVDVK